MTLLPEGRMPIPHCHESWDEAVYGLIPLRSKGGGARDGAPLSSPLSQSSKSLGKSFAYPNPDKRVSKTSIRSMSLQSPFQTFPWPIRAISMA
jgi:hypothetical protein